MVQLRALQSRETVRPSEIVSCDPGSSAAKIYKNNNLCLNKKNLKVHNLIIHIILTAVQLLFLTRHKWTLQCRKMLSAPVKVNILKEKRATVETPF